MVILELIEAIKEALTERKCGNMMRQRKNLSTF
jgi:hypothetical protein